MTETYYFDTYAIIEIIKGNPAYDRFKYAKIVLSIFNLVELHYKLLRDFNKKIADDILQKYSDFAVDVDLEIIKEANAVKLRNRKKRLSAPDVIGYITAQKLGIDFLTGDKQFKGMKGVEFVK